MSADSRSTSSKARPKQQLSCGHCRARKSRCDRQRPCSQCIRSHSICIYPETSSTSRNKSKTKIEDRIGSLEHKLQTLIHSAGQSSASERSTSTSKDELVESPAPRLHTNGTQTHFVDSSHWEGILDDIHSLRQDLHQHDESVWTSVSGRSHQSNTDSITNRSPYILLGDAETVELDELLHPVIPKSLIDNLLNFLLEQNRIAGLLIVLHIPSFRSTLAKVYQKDAEEEIDLAWMASLYAVVSIASHTADRLNVTFDDVPLDRLSYTCMKKAAQCLRHSDYINRPNQWTTGSMILYLGAEHPFVTSNGTLGATVVLSLAVRVAVQMGYHRDPARYKNDIPIFEAEMRRRTWLFLTQLDHLTSVKSGLPRLIDERTADTALPQNLIDQQLSPDLRTLPPPLPSDEPSPISFLNHKSALLLVLGDIKKQKDSASLEDIQALDVRLTEVVNRCPSWLTHPGIISTSPPIFISAVEVELIEQSARMQLHRKFLLPAHKEQRYQESRLRCLKSAERALYLQTLLAQDQQKQGLRENWRFIALVGHDFLTAAMLLCLDIDYSLRRKDTAIESSDRQRRIDMIMTACDIWSSFSTHDQSGSKAAEILSSLLQQFGAASSNEIGSAASQSDSMHLKSDMPDLHTAATGLSWQDVPSSFSIGGDEQIQAMLEMSNVDIDWNAWSNDFAMSTNGFDLDL